MTTGWRCPNCGKVYSPHVMECVPCNKAVDEAKKPKDNTGPGLGEVEARVKNTLHEAQELANEASRTFHSVRLFKDSGRFGEVCFACGGVHEVGVYCPTLAGSTP